MLEECWRIWKEEKFSHHSHSKAFHQYPRGFGFVGKASLVMPAFHMDTSFKRCLLHFWSNSLIMCHAKAVEDGSSATLCGNLGNEPVDRTYFFFNPCSSHHGAWHICGGGIFFFNFMVQFCTVWDSPQLNSDPLTDLPYSYNCILLRMELYFHQSVI